MILRVLTALLLLALVAYGLLFPRIQAPVAVGTGFIAKQMCSCIHVGGRSFESCRPDMMPAMDEIEAAPVETGDGIRAWVTGIAESHAYYDPATGCTLQ